MRDSDDQRNGQSLAGGEGTDLPSAAVERLVAYEEARAEGNGEYGSLDAIPVASDHRVRLAEDMACVDLLHRVWPDFDIESPARSPLPALHSSPLAPHSSLLAPRSSLGDFEIVCEIARGGMGVVYEAWQVSLARRVALKVLPFSVFSNDQQLRRFKNEARASATLQHPHIVPVYSIGSEGDVHYYTMRLINGPSLAEVLKELGAERGAKGKEQGARSGEQELTRESWAKANDTLQNGSTDASGRESPMRSSAVDRSREVTATVMAEYVTSKSTYFRTVARWGVQLAEALAHAHENGVLHRDIKSANILLDARGQPWITDFGLAKLRAESTMTTTGALVGTLRYMSPEQAMGKRLAIDQRADVYSLGITLYELLTLQPALAGQDREELLQQIAFEEPRGLRKLDRAIPIELEIIIRKSIHKSRGDRYESAQELADDLERFLNDKPIRARRPGILRRVAKWARRRPAAAALVAVTARARRD